MTVAHEQWQRCRPARNPWRRPGASETLHPFEDGFNNLDASILKNFNFTGAAHLQLRFETFNTLNHPAFTAPNTSSATAANFGTITAVPSTAQPRQVQFGARIVF